MVVDSVHPFSCLPAVGGRPQSVHHMDAFDDQDAVTRRFYFAGDFGSQFSVLGINFAHIQCAAKRAHQSTADRRHQVVESGGMRFADIRWTDSVVGSNGSMNAEGYRRRLPGKVRISQRALLSFNPRFG
jgi:hypothetical protein